MRSASLSVGAFGDEVAELQSKLLAYGYALSPGEIERKFFGPATREAMQKFQAEHGLRSTGEVDEATARVLVETPVLRREQPTPVERVPSLKQAMPTATPAGTRTAAAEPPFRIQGRVIDRQGQGSADLRVEAWDKDLILHDLVGSAITDEQGAFQMQFEETYFRELFLDRQPNLFFKVFRENVLIKSTEKSVVWNVETAKTPIAIEVDLAAAEETPKAFVVQGKVGSRERAGIGGLRVEIVDRNVGETIHLADTVTGDDGAYEAAFTIANLARRGKTKPDLQTRVFRGETLLCASEIRYNASNRETLDIALTKEAASALASEHETLTSTLAAHFRGNLRDLKETDDQQDITYLANKTGWDARAVALAALADQFSSRTTDEEGGSLEPALFYALFRAGLPANENGLYQIDPKTAEAVWTQGIDAGIIPASLSDGIPRAVERFQSLAAKRALNMPALVGVSSLKEMLSLSLGDDAEKHAQFAELQATYRGDNTKFWEAVREEFGEAAEKRLHIDGQLGYLTSNNVPLIRKLHAHTISL